MMFRILIAGRERLSADLTPEKLRIVLHATQQRMESLAEAGRVVVTTEHDNVSYILASHGRKQ